MADRRYRAFLDGRLVGEHVSDSQCEVAVLALDGEDAEVAKWAKDRPAASRWITTGVARALNKKGKRLKIVEVELVKEVSDDAAEMGECGSSSNAAGAEMPDSEPEFAFEPESESATLEPEVDATSLGKAVGEAIVQMVVPSGGLVTIERIYRHRLYKGSYEPRTDQITIDGVTYRSPSAAAMSLTGKPSQVNGRKWFGLPPRRMSFDGGVLAVKAGRGDGVVQAEAEKAKAQLALEKLLRKIATIQEKLAHLQTLHAQADERLRVANERCVQA